MTSYFERQNYLRYRRMSDGFVSDVSLN